MPELLTARLRLRPWRDDDLDLLAEMHADPEVMRYVGDGSVRTRDETAAWLNRIRADGEEQGHGLFAVELRETGELTGWTGTAVPNFLPEVLPAVEIGWRLARRFWGHGIATEAARAVLEHAFDGVGLDRILSICNVDNTASESVMRKLGMHLDRETTVPAHGRRVRVHAITREEHTRG
ncbi:MULTISPECIES: GNAT family N-acetyltransferase [Streptomyces]|uniref:GNAT family N-acetyltransferase n=1 Tax=Streptomyces caniscabiei TaxID=2746961 RepID=A0ABU4N2G9_9ACTN|nr:MULTISPECIES: GNAT family N-acetyltransferase [Streptomyces]MBE4741863.1 GNAT family N-acetyltransferase [Streptomyces caniscabiei]MBE4762552.1 GNAT family N-acetyltransferase [Streptomyces caniscabiei]MBE4775811.1 GNAT family N-acetyltransferase [Streptomyces caniscabiei]MBE4790643.1 GNAT family N-acetyltransferase [Streptomyces caniscabiei]MBE4799841.1 GNAT family N-acetyltransferase [Streptomyces caniscabiei]